MVGLNFLLVVPAVLLIELNGPRLVTRTGARGSSYWLAWLLLAFAVLLFTFNGPFSSLEIGGLVQRLYWFTLAVWLLLKAARFLRAGLVPYIA
jgi:hypothetical protein